MSQNKSIQASKVSGKSREYPFDDGLQVNHPPKSRRRLNRATVDVAGTNKSVIGNLNHAYGIPPLPSQHHAAKQPSQIKSSQKSKSKKMQKQSQAQVSSRALPQWYFIDIKNKEYKCDTVLNNILNNLAVSSSTTYYTNNLKCNAIKLSTTIVQQENTITKEKCMIYTKSTMSNNTNNNNICKPAIQEQKQNEGHGNHIRARWAFIDEHNVLIEVGSQYQSFLNELNVNKHKIYGNIYSVIKLSNSHAKQQNIQSKTVRQLFRVLYKNDNNIKTKVSVEMIKALFHRSVDSNVYKIDKIEKIAYRDQDLYFTIYNKYKKYHFGKSLERWLFHGTDTKLLTQIERNGFDRNFNKTSAYGKV